jgi:ABC-type uncharacterized transport system permease subunit
MNLDLHALTAAVYLLAAILATLGASLRNSRVARAAVATLAAGALVHAGAFLAFHEFQFPPPSTGLPGAVSLMAWFGTIFYLAVASRLRLRGLAVVVAPAAFLGVFFAAIARGTGPETPAEAGALWGAVHVVLASAGLALGGVAGAAGLLFVLHHRGLKQKRRKRSSLPLPPLEALDRVNSLAVALGFLLISLGVVTGVLWVQETRGELWPGSPHANAMLVAWAIYGALVISRSLSATGALLAARSAVIGFAFLALAVAGVEVLG